MRIWVDADACPRPVKQMLYRASERTGVEVILVANQALRVPPSGRIRVEVVGRGFDVADEHIADSVEAGELVVTQDIPLAVAVIDKGAHCIDVRGEVIDASNARSRLAMRDLLEALREGGEENVGGGPKAWSPKDSHRFAASLDRWLQKIRRS